METVAPYVFTRGAWVPPELSYKVRTYNPKSHLGKLVREMALTYRIPPDAAEELVEAITRCVVLEAALSVVVHRGKNSDRPGSVEDYGVVGRKLVTDVGVGYIVDAFQNSVEMENMKYHGLGTGTTAESAAHTALVTELTTEYTSNVRATGTTTEGASANIYSTVATNTLDGTPGAALREHGLFSASSSGVMFDRTLFDAITLVSGDGFQSTYQATFSSGG